MDNIDQIFDWDESARIIEEKCEMNGAFFVNNLEWNFKLERY